MTSFSLSTQELTACRTQSLRSDSPRSKHVLPCFPGGGTRAPWRVASGSVVPMPSSLILGFSFLKSVFQFSSTQTLSILKNVVLICIWLSPCFLSSLRNLMKKKIPQEERSFAFGPTQNKTKRTEVLLRQTCLLET